MRDYTALEIGSQPRDFALLNKEAIKNRSLDGTHPKLVRKVRLEGGLGYKTNKLRDAPLYKLDESKEVLLKCHFFTMCLPDQVGIIERIFFLVYIPLCAEGKTRLRRAGGMEAGGAAEDEDPHLLLLLRPRSCRATRLPEGQGGHLHPGWKACTML